MDRQEAQSYPWAAQCANAVAPVLGALAGTECRVWLVTSGTSGEVRVKVPKGLPVPPPQAANVANALDGQGLSHVPVNYVR